MALVVELMAQALARAVQEVDSLRELAEAVRDWNADHNLGWVPSELVVLAESKLRLLDEWKCRQCGDEYGVFDGLCEDCVIQGPRATPS